MDWVLRCVQLCQSCDEGWIHVCGWWEGMKEIFQWNTPITDGHSTPRYCIWHWWHSPILWRPKIFQICFLDEVQRPIWLNWPQNILHLWPEARQCKYWTRTLLGMSKISPSSAFLCKIDHAHAGSLDCTGQKMDVWSWKHANRACKGGNEVGMKGLMSGG